MRKNKVKLGLSLLTVLATPIAVNSVINNEVQAEYRGSIFYYNNEPANWWHMADGEWYYFKNGKKHTGIGQDSKGTHYFDNGKYANGKHNGKIYVEGKEVIENIPKEVRNAYANGIFYEGNGKPANWWHMADGEWYYFKNGKKHTGIGQDSKGTHYFDNGKYANGKHNGKMYVEGKEVVENIPKEVRNAYANGIFYEGNGKPANWWHMADGEWYYFKNGKKHTGIGQDSKGTHYFVNGKYATAKEENKNTKRAIFLDPGHGGSDSGAVSNGLREKDLTLSVYNKVSSRLASLGYSVLTSRNTDKGVGLVDRADQANKSNADMFLSIHFNAGGRGASYGIETYYYKARPEYTPAINKDKHNDPERLEKSRKLAQKIQQSLVSKTGAYDRGVKRETFAVLRETSIPSILVELGFIDNQEEANKIKTNEYQEKLADGIVDGIVEYYK